MKPGQDAERHVRLLAKKIGAEIREEVWREEIHLTVLAPIVNEGFTSWRTSEGGHQLHTMWQRDNDDMKFVALSDLLAEMKLGFKPCPKDCEECS